MGVPFGVQFGNPKERFWIIFGGEIHTHAMYTYVRLGPPVHIMAGSAGLAQGGVAMPVYARAARPSILWSRGTCLTTPPVPLRASRKIKLNNEKDAAEVSEIAKAMVKFQKD